MLSLILDFLYNNIFYIIVFLGIFVVTAIYSAKARNILFVFLSFGFALVVIYIINFYSGNNITLRSILITIVTVCINAFHLFVLAFTLNIHVFQMAYSSGLYDMLYNITFDVVSEGVVGLIHLTFSIKNTIKKAYVYIYQMMVNTFTYAKNIILDSIFGSFLQVLRV